VQAEGDRKQPAHGEVQPVKGDTNSLYGAIDPQFYPDGIEGWMVKLDANPGGASPSTRGSWSNGRPRIGRIRFGSRAAIARRTRIAIRERPKVGLRFYLTVRS